MCIVFGIPFLVVSLLLGGAATVGRARPDTPPIVRQVDMTATRAVAGALPLVRVPARP